MAGMIFIVDDDVNLLKAWHNKTNNVRLPDQGGI